MEKELAKSVGGNADGSSNSIRKESAIVRFIILCGIAAKWSMVFVFKAECEQPDNP